MSLPDVLEKLYARRRFGIRPGVDRVGVLLSRLGHPEKQFHTIHVVGTNGKGSTSAFLSSILCSAGYKTAQFSSPHLVRFTERFRINGVEYCPEKLASSLAHVLAVAPDEATFFEITTALAADIFAQEQVQYAVMEAGMGGRSDATAALPGELTVLTPISLDHTDYLGATVAEIAREKAGIIGAGTPVVTACQDDVAMRVIVEQCAVVGSPLFLYGSDFRMVRTDTGTLSYRGLQRTLAGLVPGIAGRYQTENAAVALAAAELLAGGGLCIGEQAYVDGIAAAHWPGRMELIPGTPRLLLDGAHNPAGARALAEALADYPRARLLLVAGVCDDKDLERIFAPLLPLVSAVYTVTPAIERGLDAAVLAEYFARHQLHVQAHDTVAAGLAAACHDATADDLVLVCGSLFVVGEVKAVCEQSDYHGIRG